MNPLIMNAMAVAVFAAKILAVNQLPAEYQLSQHQMSLDKRYENASVNQVFKDNILLTTSYMVGKVKKADDINWNDIEKPFSFKIVLQPNQTFAFHDMVLPQYNGKVMLTTNAHFSADEGFKNDGYLYGDGVCHFASLIKWAAVDAKLDVVAPTSHDFAQIPEIPREDGVAIFTQKNAPNTSENQNLYITNNHTNPVNFYFVYDGKNLQVTVTENN